MGIGLGLGIQFYKKAGARLSAFLTWGQSVPARFWGTETPEYWGGIDPQAQIAYDSLIAAGFTTPQGLGGINAAFSVVKEIYGTSDITTAISFFGDPSLAYEAGAGTGTTAGQAIRTLPNIIDPTRATDAVQTTAASQPLLLVHSGENYWQGVGVAGNACQTVSSYVWPTTSGIIIEADIHLTDSVARQIASKDGNSGTNRVFVLGWNGTSFNLLFGSGFSYNAICSVTTAVGYNGWIKCEALTVGSDMAVKFYTSNDGITYTQLGTTVTVAGAANSMPTGSSPYQIGANGTALSNTWAGKIRRVLIKDASGNLIRDFNPNQYNPSTSQTQWTSSTGEVWTINVGTATTGYKGVLVDRTIMQSDGVDDFIVTSTIPSQQYYTSFVAATLYTNPNTAPRLLSGNGDSHLIFKTGANAFEAFNGLQMAFTGESINTSLMWIVDYNSTSSKTWINNANETSGSTGTNTSNRLSLFGGVTGATLSNATISTIVRPTALANNTQRTAMYNYIRSINNAAF